MSRAGSPARRCGVEERPRACGSWLAAELYRHGRWRGRLFGLGGEAVPKATCAERVRTGVGARDEATVAASSRGAAALSAEGSAAARLLEPWDGGEPGQRWETSEAFMRTCLTSGWCATPARGRAGRRASLPVECRARENKAQRVNCRPEVWPGRVM